eukprot:224040-Prymnesium_polylepis.1
MDKTSALGVPISPRIDTYLVPATAPQGARSARYRHMAHHRPWATLCSAKFHVALPWRELTQTPRAGKGTNLG